MHKLFGGIYKGKKVFVTGHTGFKGSWLVFWLKEMGADVMGYSLEAPTKPNHFELLDLKVKTVTGDIRDFKKLEQAIKKYKPDIIFHLAAQPIVRTSYEEPMHTIETNIMGTTNLLEAARRVGTRSIVCVTSDKCYQNSEQIWGYREEDPMGGNDPYSASKGASELIAHAYRTSYFNDKDYGKKHHTLLATVRAGNVIGGGDWAKDRLIPDIMKATSKKQTVPIRNPHATRPWQHVLEPLSGYLQVGARLIEGKKEYSTSWNFGPSDAGTLTVGEVTDYTRRYWDDIKYEIQQSDANPHEAKLLKLDSSKAHLFLGWHSVWDNETTFEKTVVWYKNYYTNKKEIMTKYDLVNYVEEATKLKLIWTQ